MDPVTPSYQAKVVQYAGAEPEWFPVRDKDHAISLTDQFVFWDWVSLDFYLDGKIAVTVRPGEDGTPLIVAVIQGGQDGESAS